MPQPNQPTANDAANEPAETSTSANLSEQERKTLDVRVDRDARQTLRRVQQHLVNAPQHLGAQHEVVSLVEVLYHEHNPLSTLNYVTPRRKTAWVSAAQVQQGLDYLRERNRRPRVVYIEGLMPPLFARTLRGLDLALESETPLMIYQAKDGQPLPAAPKPPYNVRVQVVDDVRSAEVWWYVWQNAYYDVFTLGVEPLFVGRTHAAARQGMDIDVLMYHDSFPFGAARLTIHQKTAHLVGAAVFREKRTPAVTRLLMQQALQAALENGCDLLFAPGDDPDERDNLRALGFVDFGSIVCYAANTEPQANGKPHDAKPLVQPIFNLR